MTVPVEADWQRFQSAMAEAARLYVDDDADRAGYNAATILALGAATDLMQSCGFPAEQWNILHRLALALSDLKAGYEVAPILKPPDRTKRGPKRASSDALVQRAFIAALLHECLARSAFPNLEQAARWVARKAAALPEVRAAEGAGWRVVIRWRDAARGGRAHEDTDRATFDGIVESLAKERALPLEAIAKATLEAAKHAGHPVQRENRELGE